MIRNWWNNSSALRLMGQIFAAFGGFFVAVGIIMLCTAPNTDEILPRMLFCAVGSLFLALGLVFVYLDSNRKKKARVLMENGRYVWGEIHAMEPNVCFRFNGMHPYFARVWYFDGAGGCHVFDSESRLGLCRRKDLVGARVKVYVEDMALGKYHVDIDSVL